MADIKLKRDDSMAATYVPNSFIDEHMAHADGEFVKIYLYLLRCMSDTATDFSVSGIADKFDDTEKDVIRALKYWEKEHLLRLEYDDRSKLTGICLLQPYANAQPQADTQLHTDVQSCAAAQPQAVQKTASEQALECTYSPSQLAQFQEDATIQETLFVTERYLGRLLNDKEMQLVIYWLDTLKFSPDMVDYLVELSVAKNHPNLSYMHCIAMSWAQQDIHTLAAAKQETELHSRTSRAVKKAYGIYERNLSAEEMDFVKQWAVDMGFSDELIANACERTINHLHHINFKYTHSILDEWKNQDAYTLEAIRILDEKHELEKKKNKKRKPAGRLSSRTGTVTNGFANFTQRTYNFEELERKLLANT